MRALPVSIALCAATLAGCGGSTDATEKRLSDLHTEVVKLRAENAALAERLDGVELRGHTARAAAATAAPPAEVATREQPELDVVRLSPEGGASDDPDAEGPRPVLRGAGKTGTIDEGKGPKPVAPAAAPKPSPLR